MSLKIYLDDCAYSKSLLRLLTEAGHQVQTPIDAGIVGQPDPVHFQYTIEHKMVLLTKNPSDFLELHLKNPNHSGIMAIYQDNDVKRDMKNIEIVHAIDNLLKAGITIEGNFHILNAWKFKFS